LLRRTGDEVRLIEIVPYIRAVPPPIWGALIAGLFALIVAEIYTKRIKQIEATLEFSKRYHELLKDQHELNEKHYFDKDGKRYADPQQITDAKITRAHVFFYQLFDLFLNEFEYFKKGLMDETRFSNWMRWRWTDYNDKRHENPIPFNIDAFGKSYKEEWKFLVSDNRAVWPTDFFEFLSDVHGASSINEVERVVHNARPLRVRVHLLAFAFVGVIALGSLLAASYNFPSPSEPRPARGSALLAAICTIHLLYKSGSLMLGTATDYDRQAQALLGGGDIETVCRQLAQKAMTPPQAP
jgi:hypothetical protein